MEILYIIIFVITIILFMPIKVVVQKDNGINDITLYLVKIFNIRFDLDRFIKRIIRKANMSIKDKFTKNIEYYKQYKSFIKTFINLITIKKITIIISTISLYASFATWNIVYAVRNYLKMNLIEVENEYYNVCFDSTNKIKIELVFYVRIIYFIVSFIINIKEFINIKKRGIKNVRSSN